MLGLSETVREIVERSFPKLQGIEISCRLVESAEDFLAGIQWIRSSPPQIVLSFSAEDRERMPVAAMKGCLVHELCHAEYDLALSPSVFAENDQRYASDSEYRSAHEREIDRVVIEKGYGPELLALQVYHNQHYEAYGPSDGLTPEETLDLIRQITDR